MCTQKACFGYCLRLHVAVEAEIDLVWLEKSVDDSRKRVYVLVHPSLRRPFPMWMIICGGAIIHWVSADWSLMMFAALLLVWRLRVTDLFHSSETILLYLLDHANEHMEFLFFFQFCIKRSSPEAIFSSLIPLLEKHYFGYEFPCGWPFNSFCDTFTNALFTFLKNGTRVLYFTASRQAIYGIVRGSNRAQDVCIPMGVRFVLNFDPVTIGLPHLESTRGGYRQNYWTSVRICSFMFTI